MIVGVCYCVLQHLVQLLHPGDVGATSGTSQQGGPCGAGRTVRPQKLLMGEEYLTFVCPLENKEGGNCKLLPLVP